MLQNLFDKLLEPLLHGSGWLQNISRGAAVIFLILAAIIVYYFVKILITNIVPRIARTERSGFLRIISKNKTIYLFAHIFSGLVIWAGSKFVVEHNNIYSDYEAIILNKLSLLYIFIVCLIITSRIIWSLNNYYEKKFQFARQYPIYSYLKVVLLFVWVIGVVLILSFFLNTSPWALLTGVGAVSAVFLLVFKDTLLGIISSIQATALNIVRIGDRISLDKYNVDGTVLDISINTVKIKNGDNTVANIPTYMLTSEIVKNWRGIEESGVRRIKRAVYLDVESIRECDETLLGGLKQFDCVKKHLESNPEIVVSNLGLFRVYFKDYLNHSQFINHEQVTYVRHLDPTPNGLPLEISAFTNTVILSHYEQIQADVFEHLFCMLPRFGLKAFKPSK